MRRVSFLLVASMMALPGSLGYAADGDPPQLSGFSVTPEDLDLRAGASQATFLHEEDIVNAPQGSGPEFTYSFSGTQISLMVTGLPSQVDEVDIVFRVDGYHHSESIKKAAGEFRFSKNVGTDLRNHFDFRYYLQDGTEVRGYTHGILGFVSPPKLVFTQKTLASFATDATALTALQKSQVKAALVANPNAEKFICTGIRYYSQSMSINIMVRKRAKAACEYAKALNPELSTWFQNKPTEARSYAGKVLLTIKSPAN